MKHIDLNLLRLLESLMTERSVTRTGERLGITQPAVSHGLKRAREMIGDPLFVRGAAGLEPTARMRQIEPMLRDGLAKLRDALQEPHFDPLRDDRRFTIAAASYVCAILIPPLIERLQAVAPKVELRILAIPDDIAVAMSNRSIDLVLGNFERLPPRLNSTHLFDDQAVWLVNARHPILGTKPSLQDLLDLPRVVTNVAADFEGIRGRVVSGGVQRRISVDLGEYFGVGVSGPANGVVSVYDVRTALSIVARTQLATFVPRRMAEAVAWKGDLVVIEPPVETAPLSVAMLWHRELGEEPSIAWLRNVVVQVAEEFAS